MFVILGIKSSSVWQLSLRLNYNPNLKQISDTSIVEKFYLLASQISLYRYIYMSKQSIDIQHPGVIFMVHNQLLYVHHNVNNLTDLNADIV